MNALDDSAITDRCTLYEDSAKFLKDERFTKNIGPKQTFERWSPRTQESPHELARQSEANVCRRRRRTKNPSSLIAQVTQ